MFSNGAGIRMPACALVVTRRRFAPENPKVRLVTPGMQSNRATSSATRACRQIHYMRRIGGRTT